METSQKEDERIYSRPVRRLKRGYLIAVVLIVVSIVLAQVATRYYLKTQENDARIINVAARQRMLSQHIAKEMLHLSMYPEEAKKRIKQLSKSYITFKRSHENLTKQSRSMGFTDSYIISEEVDEAFNQLEPYYQNICVQVRRVEQLVNEQEAVTQEDILPSVLSVLENEEVFLPWMNRIVWLFETEASSKLQNIKEIELYLSFVLFIVLLLEVVFIFRPLTVAAERAIKKSVKAKNETLAANRRLSETNYKLAASEEEIRQNLEELNTVNDHLEQNYSKIRVQENELRSKNENITASIRYAKRIQQSFLPSKTTLQAVIGEHCLFYLPRDIISGDFYWTHIINSNEYIVAVADCTGHGVPGAFMSMLGTNLLNSIITQEGVISVEKVLDKLHKGVQDALRQESSENKDGMDISLVYINKKERLLEFAGAKGDMIIVPEGKELTRTKGDKISIGGYYKAGSQYFAKQSFYYLPKTRLYLYSDGYQDQFGGPDTRKFMNKRLRELIDSLRDTNDREPMQIF